MLASRGVCVGGHPKPASGSETSRVVRGVLFHPGETAGCAAPPDGGELIEVQRQLARSLALPKCGLQERMRWGEGPWAG